MAGYRLISALAERAWQKAVHGVEGRLRPCQSCGRQPQIGMERRIDLVGEAFQIRCPNGHARHDIQSHTNIVEEREGVMYARWEEAIKILGEWWDEKQEEVRVASMFPGAKK